MNSLQHLTGFRGIAALLVVFYHIRGNLTAYVNEETIYFLSKGYLAVDFFFILSGFVIAYNYFERLVIPAKAQIIGFYIKRFARIYPLHLLILLAYLLIPLAYGITGKQFYFQGQYSLEGFIYGLFLLQTWGWLDDITWNVPAWSISTELLAYIFFPFMVWIIQPIKRYLGITGIICFIIITNCFIAVIFDAFGNQNIGQNIQSVGAFRCLSEFFIGVCTWLAYHNYKTQFLKIGRLLFYGGIGLFVSFSVTDITNHYYIPVTMATILLGSICHHSMITRLFSSHFFVWLGDISYSIYLTHYLIRDLFKILFMDSPTASLIWIVSYVLVVICVSHLLYKYFEMPSKQLILKTTLRRPKVKLL